jgi:uncharacterized RDD family membrane protein YckC
VTDPPDSAAGGTERPSLSPQPAPSAPFLRRITAFLIDLALLNVLGFCLALAALYGMALGLWQTGESLPSRNLVFSLAEYAAAAWPLLVTGYFGYFTGQGGQTPGKMALGIMVITTQNSAIGLWQAWWRSLIVCASLPVFAVFVIAVFTPQKRALHDYLAGTRVIMLTASLQPYTQAQSADAVRAATPSAMPPTELPTKLPTKLQ